MRTLMDLSHVSNDELLSTVRVLVANEREIRAQLVAYLGEVEERRLHLEAGFPSMFAFCMKELGMSENEAFRRLLAARLARRFPVIHSLLASGAVHFSALELLRERMTERVPPSRPEDVSSHFRKLRYRVEFTVSAELRDKPAAPTISSLPSTSLVATTWNAAGT